MLYITDRFYERLIHEKYLLTKHYPSLRCEIREAILICRGLMQPNAHCREYYFELEYGRNAFNEHLPLVRIVYPIIKTDIECHMYRSGHLCLYYKEDRSFTNDSNLYNTIIPWTAEWIVYYELYQLGHGWLGKSAPHSYAGK